jgi:hypothetical protein
MSDAAEKLARSRQAILQHVAKRQRKHDPHEEPAGAGFAGLDDEAHDPYDEPPDHGGGGWFAHMRRAVRTWWRYHPAHMAVELASPLMRNYARRRPMQLLGISLATGAALTFARPWRLISITTLAIAVLKSSQLSSLLMAAMSAADYRKDNERPE